MQICVVLVRRQSTIAIACRALGTDVLLGVVWVHACGFVGTVVPSAVVKHGSSHLHGAEAMRWVSEDGQHTMRVASLDAGLLCYGEPTAFPTPFGENWHTVFLCLSGPLKTLKSYRHSWRDDTSCGLEMFSSSA